MSRFEQWTSTIFTITILAGLPQFVWREHLVPISPTVMLIVFAVAFIPIMATRREMRIPRSLFWWGAGLVVISVVSLSYAEMMDAGRSALWARISFLFVLLVSAWLVGGAAAERGMRRGAFAAALIISLGNVFDIATPEAFGLSRRASGFFENPNVSGMSLVLAMVLASKIVVPWLLPGFQLIAGIGVLVTFSRASIVAWVITVIGANLLSGRFEGRSRLLGWGLLAVCCITVVVTPVLQNLAAWVNDSVDIRSLDRLATLRSDALVEDDPRSDLVGEYWQLFGMRPIAGYGLGGSSGGLSESGLGPHNAFLATLIDGGMLAVWIVPSLLIIVASKIRSVRDIDVIGIVLVITILAFVSHTLLVQWGYALAIGVAVGAMRRPAEVDSRGRSSARKFSADSYLGAAKT